MCWLGHVPLVLQAREISQSHYADVVEERTIERLCGYPLCGCGLGHVTKQRYHISVQRREVLDLTERKVEHWGRGALEWVAEFCQCLSTMVFPPAEVL